MATIHRIRGPMTAAGLGLLAVAAIVLTGVADGSASFSLPFSSIRSEYTIND